MKRAISLILCIIVSMSLFACVKDVPNEEMPTDIESAATGEIVTLYFPDENVFSLKKEERVISDSDNIAKSVVEEVIKGPEGELLNKAIYGEVKVISAVVQDGLCTVDVTKEFKMFNEGGSTQELMAIYSIVNSLCELKNVDKVKLNLEGSPDWDFGGHFYMGDILEFDENIVG